MNKETIATILRAVLTFVGFFLIGKNVLGKEIDASYMEALSGFVLSSWFILWGVFEKKTNIEQWQSFLRSLIVAVGGILMAKGYATEESMNQLLAGLLAIVPMIYSTLSKEKTKSIAEGKISVDDLKQ